MIKAFLSLNYQTTSLSDLENLLSKQKNCAKAVNCSIEKDGLILTPLALCMGQHTYMNAFFQSPMFAKCELLISYGADISYKGAVVLNILALFRRKRRNSPALTGLIKWICSHDFDANFTPKNGVPILSLACYNGFVLLASELLQKGAGVNGNED
jgi:hypothetical protein